MSDIMVEIELEKDLQSLYDQILEKKLTSKDLEQLPSLKALLELGTAKAKRNTLFKPRDFIFIGFFALAIVSCIAVPNHPFQNVLQNTWNKLNFGRWLPLPGDCLVKAPNKAADWFRPPVNCDLCRNITKVDAVSSISVEEFTAKYAYNSVPLVIRSATKNWTATNILTFDFFREIYVDSYPGSLDVLEEHCQFFPYKTEFKSLREVLNMSQERAKKTWYVGWSNCDISVATLLRTLYSRPTFLPAGSQSGRFDWVFMGTPGYGANMHVDNVGKPSWQAQIRGSKLWSLEPPRECYFQCQNLEVMVNPGDLIILDTDVWYHSTLITGDEVSVTIGSEYD